MGLPSDYANTITFLPRVTSSASLTSTTSFTSSTSTTSSTSGPANNNHYPRLITHHRTMASVRRFLHAFRTSYTAVSDRDPDGEQTTHTRLRLADLLKSKRIRTILAAVLALLLLSSLVTMVPAGTMGNLSGDRFGFAPGQGEGSGGGSGKSGDGGESGAGSGAGSGSGSGSGTGSGSGSGSGSELEAGSGSGGEAGSTNPGGGSGTEGDSNAKAPPTPPHIPAPSASTSPASDPSIPIDWTQFAYTQYVTNTAYLCNSVMLFEILHRLGTRADRLMMYPAYFLASENSESREAKLLRKARDEYGVKLQPIEVQRRSGQDGEFLNSLFLKGVILEISRAFICYFVEELWAFPCLFFAFCYVLVMRIIMWLWHDEA